MTRTISARISNKIHSKLLENCNKKGCTINEWLNAAVSYVMTGSTEFNFDGKEFVKKDKPIEDNKSTNENVQTPSNEILRPTVTRIE